MVALSRKLHIHYAWFILFACCMFFGSAMGIYGNCSALYTADLLAEMDWSLTLITVAGTLCTLSRVIGTRCTSTVFRLFPIKPVLGIAIVVMMAGAILSGLMRDMATYCIIQVLVGFSGAFLLYVPVPILINNWFVEKRETALGIAMLCSGLFAAVLSPVFSALMETRGWRYACVVNGIVALAVALPATLLIVVKTPEEVGLKPYGWKEPEPMKVAKSPSEVFENGHPDYAAGYSPLQKKRLFFLSAVLAMFMSALSGIPTKLPHFASTSGLGASIGALMLSVSQFGNMASKAFMGPLCDKFGPKKTYTVSTFLVFLAYLALCFMPTADWLLLVIAFLAGISAGNNMMIYPAAVRTYSRGDEYAWYISRVSMCLIFFGTPFSLLVSLLFDRTGGYFWVFVLYAVLEAVSCLMTFCMFSDRKEEKK